MWVLKPGLAGWYYDEQKRKIENKRDTDLFVIRETAEAGLYRLFLEYHEEVPGEEGSEPTYPLRGGIEWKKV